MQTNINNINNMEDYMLNTLNALMIDIRNNNIDMRTNIETPIFLRIKGSYKILQNDFIDYITDQNNIPNYEYNNRMKTELARIDNYIQNIDNIIKSRSYEFRYRVSQLVQALGNENQNNLVTQLLQTVDLYGELTL